MNDSKKLINFTRPEGGIRVSRTFIIPRRGYRLIMSETYPEKPEKSEKIMEVEEPTLIRNEPLRVQCD